MTRSGLEKVMDPVSICSERLDPDQDPVCPEILDLDPDSVNIRNMQIGHKACSGIISPSSVCEDKDDMSATDDW